MKRRTHAESKLQPYSSTRSSSRGGRRCSSQNCGQLCKLASSSFHDDFSKYYQAKGPEGDNTSDTPTACTAKIPTTSHGFQSKENMKVCVHNTLSPSSPLIAGLQFGFMILAHAIRKILRSRTKNCTSPIGRNAMKVDVGE